MITKKLHILFITAFEINDFAGGVGTVSTTLGTTFQAMGHEAYFLSSSNGDEKIYNGIKHYFFPKPNSISANENEQFLKQLLQSLHIDFIINQACIDIPMLKMVKNAVGNNVPIFSVLHNCVGCIQEQYIHIISDSYGKRPWFKLFNNALGKKFLKAYNRFKYAKMFNAIIRYSDKFVLLSPYFIPELDIYIKNYPKEKITAIQNPAPFEVTSNPHKENIIVFVGRLNLQQKRVDLLLEIWNRLAPKYPHWKMIVVGDGPSKEMMEATMLSKNMEHITLVGFQHPKPYLLQSKIFCMTSAFEGYPMVLVEAQAMGVVPIAFNSFRALPDIIEHKVNGFCIDPFDVDAYCSTVELLMRNEDLRNNMALAAQKSIEKFNAHHIAHRWLQLFNETQTN
ncbi:MAG: glycosyltransferase [Ferruginibacter sp.]